MTTNYEKICLNCFYMRTIHKPQQRSYNICSKMEEDTKKETKTRASFTCKYWESYGNY